MIHTQEITTDAQLAALEQSWNVLADGEALRSWDWLATWWKHYRELGERELHVVAVFDDNRLIGIAPWYLERSFSNGAAICFLGSGHVCTDHLSLVCRPEDVDRVAVAVADYLATNEDWDRLELEAVDDGDPAIARLSKELQNRGCVISRHRAGNCWILDLPISWDDYLNEISSSHRRQLKKVYKDKVESGRCLVHTVTRPDELEPAWNVLVDLHQRRRQGLGEAGCFASPEFASFHREVVERLLADGMLRLSWIELDGNPFTAEYHITGRGVVHTYQSGMDADRLDESPGRLAYTVQIRRAIEDGYRQFDFMRGDEPYKAHFRGVAHPQFDYCIFPNRRLTQLRGKLERAGRSFKHWVKLGVRR